MFPDKEYFEEHLDSFLDAPYFHLFDEKSYKIEILFDWLSTLSRIFNVINWYYRKKHMIKALRRLILKQRYLRSKPLSNGGELIILAIKI